MNDQIKFSCLSCGQHIECDVTESGRPMLCPSCGANLTVPLLMSETPAPPVLDLDEENPFADPAPGTRRTSGLAIGSLICSLTSPIIWVGWIPGIILGHMARSRIRHDPALTGKGLATAGLIISYATVLFAAGLAAVFVTWGSAIIQEFGPYTPVAKNPPAPWPIPPQTAIHLSEQASNEIGWTLDLRHATIPGDPVSGEINGTDFQIGRALFRNGILRLISSDGQQWVLIHDLGDSIANRSLEFQTASGSDPPNIEIGWNADGGKKTERFQEGYAMELKFDNAKGRRIPGQIYLCVPDGSKSYIAGTFTVIVPKPKPKAQPAQ